MRWSPSADASDRGEPVVPPGTEPDAPRRRKRRLQTYERGELTVTFDPVRCIHAAECVRGLPDVFRPQERRWVQLEHAGPAEIAGVVTRCPTGALQYHLAGAADEAAPEGLAIRSTRHGPLYVRGAVRIELEDGTLIAEEHRVALCRCGASANQPFCDGSHLQIRFRDPRPDQAP